MRLGFFAGPMERSASPTLSGHHATMRISEGVSVFQLAANKGTSVEMIESFLRQKTNAGSEDGNGGDEVQGTVIILQSLLAYRSCNPPNSSS